MKSLNVRELTIVLTNALLMFSASGGLASVKSPRALVRTSTESKLSSVGEVEMGQDHGNGAEYGSEKVEAASWFAGPTTVRYCLDIAKDFPVDRTVLEKKVATIINQWVQLVKTSDHYYFNEVLKYLATDFQLIGCGGGEDVKFYFGSTSPEVEAARKGYNYHVVAIAQQTSIDTQTAWSKGFIWFAAQGSMTDAEHSPPYPPTDVFPDWTKDYQLHALLLHEVGHVFGADHIAGTIMSKGIAYLVRTPTSGWDVHQLQTDYLYHINQQRMVLEPVTNTYDFPGKLGFQAYVPNPPGSSTDTWTAPEDVFLRLVGRKPQGKISATGQYKGDYDGPAILKLKLADSIGSKLFVVSMDSVGFEFQIHDWGPGSGISVAGISPQIGYFVHSADSDGGGMVTGSLQTSSGETLRIMAQINMLNQNWSYADNGPLIIGFLDKDKVWKRLFQSNLIYQAF